MRRYMLAMLLVIACIVGHGQGNVVLPDSVEWDIKLPDAAIIRVLSDFMESNKNYCYMGGYGPIFQDTLNGYVFAINNCGETILNDSIAIDTIRIICFPLETYNFIKEEVTRKVTVISIYYSRMISTYHWNIGIMDQGILEPKKKNQF